MASKMIVVTNTGCREPGDTKECRRTVPNWMDCPSPPQGPVPVQASSSEVSIHGGCYLVNPYHTHPFIAGINIHSVSGVPPSYMKGLE